jgi:hypothetical protein
MQFYAEPEWEVSLDVVGPVSVRGPLTLQVEKGIHHPFWTTVRIQKAPYGVSLQLIAHAMDQEGANDAALYFAGQMLDYMSLYTDLPLHPRLSEAQTSLRSETTRRLIGEQEWLEAFRKGLSYSKDQQPFSRALSWYRKGLLGEGPIDSYIAFWSSIEAVGSQCARRNKRTKLGIVNQICDCFDQVWGTVDTWQVVANDPGRINEYHDSRNRIAHGAMTVDIRSIRDIAAKVPELRHLVRTFLLHWEERREQNAVRTEDVQN